MLTYLDATTWEGASYLEGKKRSALPDRPLFPSPASSPRLWSKELEEKRAIRLVVHTLS